MGAALNWKDRFKIGMRVRPTPACPIRDRTRRAVVVGFARADPCLRIRFDGIKSVGVYHHDYWEEDVLEQVPNAGAGTKDG